MRETCPRCKYRHTRSFIKIANAMRATARMTNSAPPELSLETLREPVYRPRRANVPVIIKTRRVAPIRR